MRCVFLSPIVWAWGKKCNPKRGFSFDFLFCANKKIYNCKEANLLHLEIHGSHNQGYVFFHFEIKNLIKSRSEV